MSANGQYYNYSVKEAWATLMVSDDDSSLVGPTYSSTPVRATCIQKVGFNKQANEVLLTGDDAVFGVESSVDSIDVNFEHGKVNQELLELLQGGAHWLEPGTSNYVFDDSAAPYVMLDVRINKIGKNGADVWLKFYKMKFGGLQRAADTRVFGTNQWTAKAVLTDSAIPVIKDGVATTVRAFYKEVERATGAVLYAGSDGVAPAYSSSTPTDAATGIVITTNQTIVVTKALKLASVNIYTVLLKKTSDSSLIPCAVTLSTDGLTITINPTSSLTAATGYTMVITTAVRSRDDVPFAAEVTKTFTTA